MAKHTINVILSDEEEEFVKKLVRYDRETNKLNGIDRKETFGSELQHMFYTELRELMDMMGDDVSDY